MKKTLEKRWMNKDWPIDGSFDIFVDSISKISMNESRCRCVINSKQTIHANYFTNPGMLAQKKQQHI